MKCLWLNVRIIHVRNHSPPTYSSFLLQDIIAPTTTCIQPQSPPPPVQHTLVGTDTREYSVDKSGLFIAAEFCKSTSTNKAQHTVRHWSSASSLQLSHAHSHTLYTAMLKTDFNKTIMYINTLRVHFIDTNS